MTRSLVESVQNNLFNVCTNLATDQDETPLYPSAYLPQGAIEQLEQEVDAIMELLPEKQGFILPGGVAEAYLRHMSAGRYVGVRSDGLLNCLLLLPSLQKYFNM